MTLSFVATSAQPDFVPQVVDWLREEFWHAGSPSREQQIATMLAQPDRSEETFVLLDDNVPVGTASLVNNDLPSRPGELYAEVGDGLTGRRRRIVGVFEPPPLQRRSDTPCPMPPSSSCFNQGHS